MVQAMALHPIWGGVLRIPRVQMVDAYNAVLASGV
jgi:hypothetical protein